MIATVNFQRPQMCSINIRCDLIESFEYEGFYWGKPTTRLTLTNGKTYEVCGDCQDVAKKIRDAQTDPLTRTEAR